MRVPSRALQPETEPVLHAQSKENHMSACAVFALQLEVLPPQFLGQLLARIEDELEPKIAAGSSAAYWERNTLRTTCRHHAKMLGVPIDMVQIEQIAGLTPEDYIRGLGCTPDRAGHHISAQRKLSKYAASYGWMCEAYRRTLAWEPVREALRGGRGSSGCLGIVEYANLHKYWPETFSDAVMNAWRQWKEEKGQSLYTIDAQEIWFRGKLRKAGLQALFPRFDLKIRQPTSYQLRLEDRTAELSNEVDGFVRFRQKECNVDFQIRPSTARSLRAALLGFCGYCTYVLGICGITSLRQVLTEKNVRSFIAWLRDKRKCRPRTIHSTLRQLQSLVQFNHSPFEGSSEEYTWVALLMKRLPRESKDELRKRKIARSTTYELFTRIAGEIGKILSAENLLSPIKRARLYRDYFFLRTVARHPWRRANWNGCRIDPNARPNIACISIPRRVQRNGKLPRWVMRLLKTNPAQKFWVCHFVEGETKAKNEIWEVLEAEIVKIFLKYRDTHRGIILEGRSDPGTLLINNVGKAMTNSQLTKRLGVLSRQYIGKRLDLHIIRDIVAEHAVVCGCTLETIQKTLWHKQKTSTPKYLVGLNASHGCNKLEAHFGRLMLEAA
jgi:hypothetical protein